MAAWTLAFALVGSALALSSPVAAKPAPPSCEVVSVSTVGSYPYVVVSVHEECIGASEADQAGPTGAR